MTRPCPLMHAIDTAIGAHNNPFAELIDSHSRYVSSAEMAQELQGKRDQFRAALAQDRISLGITRIMAGDLLSHQSSEQWHRPGPNPHNALGRIEPRDGYYLLSSLGFIVCDLPELSIVTRDAIAGAILLARIVRRKIQAYEAYGQARIRADGHPILPAYEYDMIWPTLETERNPDQRIAVSWSKSYSLHDYWMIYRNDEYGGQGCEALRKRFGLETYARPYAHWNSQYSQGPWTNLQQRLVQLHPVELTQIEQAIDAYYDTSTPADDRPASPKARLAKRSNAIDKPDASDKTGAGRDNEQELNRDRIVQKLVETGVEHELLRLIAEHDRTDATPWFHDIDDVHQRHRFHHLTNASLLRKPNQTRYIPIEIDGKPYLVYRMDRSDGRHVITELILHSDEILTACQQPMIDDPTLWPWPPAATPSIGNGAKSSISTDGSQALPLPRRLPTAMLNEYLYDRNSIRLTQDRHRTNDHSETQKQQRDYHLAGGLDLHIHQSIPESIRDQMNGKPLATCVKLQRGYASILKKMTIHDVTTRKKAGVTIKLIEQVEAPGEPLSTPIHPSQSRKGSRT